MLASSPRGEPAVCYVSSEHCYQKPGATWEKGERGRTAAVKQEQDSEQEVKNGSSGLKVFLLLPPTKEIMACLILLSVTWLHESAHYSPELKSPLVTG